MVITKRMKQPVREQECDLPFIRMTVSACLFSCVINIDEKITQIKQFFFCFKAASIIQCGKRNHISRTVDAPIIPVFTDGCYFSKKRSHVMIGTPIYASELYDESLGERENIEAINSFVRSRIIELGDELERRKKAR